MGGGYGGERKRVTGRRGKERVAKIDDKDDNGFSDESRVTVRRDRDGERRGK